MSKYSINQTDSFAGLLQQTTTFTDGALPGLFLMGIFLVSYFSLQTGTSLDSLQASAWVTWLSSVFFVLIGILDVPLSAFLLLLVLGVTAFQSRGVR